MRKIRMVIISALLLISLSISVILQANAVSIYTDGAYTYADIDQDNVALYGYDNSDPVLTIPEYYYGRRVSSVYDYACQNNEYLTQLDFSENSRFITSIGTKSFAECTGLSGELSLPSSIRTLGLGAFQGCTGLTSVTVNIGVKTIPVQCFNRCEGLQTVYLPSNLESIENLAFGNCSNLYDIFIPSSVTYISDSAFKNTFVTFHIYYGSYAYQYAKNNNIPYVLLDGVKLGETDRDGHVTISDVTAIQRHIADLEFLDSIYLYAADVNRDGVVDITDATELQRFLAEYDVDYPIGEVITQ